MLMQELGMSDVKIGHIQMFVVSLNRGQCCWHLEWETKGEADQNECIYRHQVDSHSQADFSSHQGCPPKQETFHAKFWLLMGEKVDGTIEERNLQSFSKACTTYTSMTPALGKWVTNSATWIVDSKDYKNEIACIIEYGPRRLSASRRQG